MLSTKRITINQLPELIFGNHQNWLQSAPNQILLDCLQLIKSCFPKIDNLIHDIRRDRLLSCGEYFASLAAAEGFTVKSSQRKFFPTTFLLECVVCGSVLKCSASSKDDFNDFPHSEQCLYCIIRKVYSCPSNEIASELLRLSTQLEICVGREMRNTKTSVACELGYHEDAVCMVMIKCFLDTGQPFPNAGSLVNELFNLDILSNVSFSPVIAGVANLINSRLTSSETFTRKEVSTLSAPTDQNINTSNHAHQSQLLSETQWLYARSKCRKCFINNIQILTLPCSHAALCTKCEVKVNRCPTCNVDICDTIRIFLS